MEKEKQIEEMARLMCEGCADYGDCKYDICECQLDEAKRLYNAGYRKASEVVREIIKDLVDFADDKERHRRINGHGVWYIDEDDVKNGITDFIDELKKKYTDGGEINVLTKESNKADNNGTSSSELLRDGNVGVRYL